LLPLVVSPGAGSELYRGLGSVTLGGLVFSTFFTLFFIPALFTVCTDLQDSLRATLRRRRKSAAAHPASPPPVDRELAPVHAGGNGEHGPPKKPSADVATGS
jgi:HAE1 family hydrophobic/amphiphilic exporter-1